MKDLIVLQLSYTHKIEFLKLSPITADLTTPQLNRLADFFTPYYVPEGHYVVREGDTARFFLLLCEGSISVMKEDPTGEEKVLVTFGAGRILGEVAFFDKGVCSASLRSDTLSTIFMMTEEKFNAFCTSEPVIALSVVVKLMGSLSQRLRLTTGRLMEFL